MTQKIDLQREEVVAYEFDSELSKDDVERIHNDLRKALSKNENIRFFADVSKLENVKAGAIIENLKLAPEYVTEIKRFAIVGDENWHKWLSKGADKVTKGEARFFSPQDKDEAQDWIRQQ